VALGARSSVQLTDGSCGVRTSFLDGEMCCRFAPFGDRAYEERRYESCGKFTDSIAKPPRVCNSVVLGKKHYGIRVLHFK